MNRRHFFKQSGISIGAVTLIGTPFSSVLAHNNTTSPLSAGKKKIGLQLFSLYADMGKNRDATLKAVSEIGYSEIETFGYRDGKFFGKTATEFKKEMEDLGMIMTSSHTGFGIYNNDTDEAWDAVKKNMEDTKATGSKWITQAGYPGAKYTKLDEVKKLADIFNRVGELAKTFGLKFAYHNHTEEFTPIEGKIPYQLYLELTDKNLVSFQMDIGHVANAMGDYVGYLLKYSGRFGSIHLRDTDVSTKAATEFGNGDVRFKEVFDLFTHAGVENYYVEQEGYDYEPIVSVRKCYEFVDRAPYVKW